MREILFKGKRIDNKEWVYGAYSPHSWVNGVRGDEPLIIIISNNGNDGTCHNVIPETVCQYTGLTDKNGVKIFEGDICKIEYFGKELMGKIVFNEKMASFEMWNNIVVGAYGEKATNTRLLNNISCTEVIGNIHDNPELLEV